MLDGLLNPIFGPIMALPSPLNLLVVSIILTALITLIYKYVADQKTMKFLKDEMKAMQKEIKTLKDQPKRMMELQKQIMEKNITYMKHSFKPMLFTFIPIIFVFGWLRAFYTELGDPVVLNLGFLNLGWLWSYILFAVIASIVLRKIFKVY